MGGSAKASLWAGLWHVVLGAVAALVSWFLLALVTQLNGNELALASAFLGGLVIMMAIAFGYIAWMILVWAVTLIPVAAIRNPAGRLLGIAVAAPLGAAGGYLLMNGSGWQFAFDISPLHTIALFAVAVLGSVSIWWSVLRSVNRRVA